jgi:hypothetical protein
MNLFKLRIVWILWSFCVALSMSHGAGLASTECATCGEPILSPPWFIVISRYQAAFKLDSDVLVTYQVESSSQYVLKVNVNPAKPGKAKALATLLMPRQYDFGNVHLNVGVYCNNFIVQPEAFPETSGPAQMLLSTALAGNGYFVSIESSSHPFMKAYAIYLIFKQAIIKYYADTLSDARRWEYEIAPYLFADIFSLADRPVRIGTGTPDTP